MTDPAPFSRKPGTRPNSRVQSTLDKHSGDEEKVNTKKRSTVEIHSSHPDTADVGEDSGAGGKLRDYWPTTLTTPPPPLKNYPPR